jgi:hypothetical protein
VQCEPKPKDSVELMKPGAVTMFGEIHGTREAPAFVAAVACHGAKVAPIILGLEIHSELGARIDRFLASNGGESARRDLLADRFWTFRDGRGSEAMVRLLETMRKLERSGRSVRVVAFDGGYASRGDRDAGMARTLIRSVPTKEAARSITLILAGNRHARTDNPGTMAWHLRQAFPTLVSLNLTHAGGSTWTCTFDMASATRPGERPRVVCGVNAVGGSDRGAQRFVDRGGTRSTPGYDGIFYVGKVSASPPAGRRASTPHTR